jgi:hypothetical protein
MKKRNPYRQTTLPTRKNGLKPNALIRTSPKDEDKPIPSIKFDVDLELAWVAKGIILTTPNRKNYYRHLPYK